MAITLFTGTSTESFDRLWEAHLLTNVGLPELWGLDPVAWFGVLGMGSLVLAIGAQQLLVRRFERAGQERLAAAAVRAHGRPGDRGALSSR